jgi:hypothetical protein
MDLEERVADLTRRVAELEARVDREEPAPAAAAPTQDGFWALSTWKTQLAEAELDGGGVLFTGAVELPSGKRYEWQAGFSTESLMASDLASAAEALSALGHPVRLLMLREILLGHSTVNSLAQVSDMGTSGQRAWSWGGGGALVQARQQRRRVIQGSSQARTARIALGQQAGAGGVRVAPLSGRFAPSVGSGAAVLATSCGGGVNQVSQQNEKAQLTRAW